MNHFDQHILKQLYAANCYPYFIVIPLTNITNQFVIGLLEKNTKLEKQLKEKENEIDKLNREMEEIKTIKDLNDQRFKEKHWHNVKLNQTLIWWMLRHRISERNNEEKEEENENLKEKLKILEGGQKVLRNRWNLFNNVLQDMQNCFEGQ